MLAMWWVMMVAMMLPSAAPMVLLFAAVNRKSRQQRRAYVPTAVFASGYLAARGGFSLMATGLQWGLVRLALLSPMMHPTSLYLGAALPIGTGLYQLTPLRHGRRIPDGAAARPVLHRLLLGADGTLLHGRVMSLWWIAGLALYVLIEKLAPGGLRLDRYTGGLLIPRGVRVLVGAGSV